jgi:hypothetical protein
MIRIPTRLALTALLFALLALLGAVFLNVVGIDALEGRNDFLFFADSGTYHLAARGELPGVEGITDSIGVASNFLGPLVMLDLVGQNYYLMLLLNTLLCLLSIASIAQSLRLDPLRLAALLLVNPLTVSSLLSVNKEILSLVVVALALRSQVRRSALSLLAAIAVALLVRWQLALFLLVLVVLLSPLNPVRRHRAWTLVALLAGLSALYVALAPVFEPIRLAFEQSAAEYEGSGLYTWLQGWQEAGAYALIFPLKAAHLLFGLGLRFDRLVAPVDLYNDGWQLLHSTMTLVLFIALWRTRRLRLDNDLVWITVLYMALFGMSPIYSPRYFYPVYVLWAAALALPGDGVALLARRPRRRARPLPAVAQRAQPTPLKGSAPA